MTVAIDMWNGVEFLDMSYATETVSSPNKRRRARKQLEEFKNNDNMTGECDSIHYKENGHLRPRGYGHDYEESIDNPRKYMRKSDRYCRFTEAELEYLIRLGVLNASKGNVHNILWRACMEWPSINEKIGYRDIEGMKKVQCELRSYIRSDDPRIPYN